MAELNKGFGMAVYNGFKEKVLEDRTNADRDAGTDWLPVAHLRDQLTPGIPTHRISL